MQDEKDFSQMKNVLNNVYSQIASFDTKAGILVSIIGIVFGFSFSFLDVFEKISNLENASEKVIQTRYWTFGAFYILFIIAALISIMFSLLVIIPRSHHKESININYYKDLKDMNYASFEENRKNFNNNPTILFNQIQINSEICYKKHKYLKKSIISLIPFAVLILILGILSICFIH